MFSTAAAQSHDFAQSQLTVIYFIFQKHLTRFPSTARRLHDSQIIVSESFMRGSNFVLVIAPLIILVMLIPAFEASTFPNAIKGGVVGLYLGISFIGLLQLYESFRP